MYLHCRGICEGHPSNQSIVMALGIIPQQLQHIKTNIQQCATSKSTNSANLPEQEESPQSIRPCVSPFSSNASLSPFLPPSLPRYRT